MIVLFWLAGVENNRAKIRAKPPPRSPTIPTYCKDGYLNKARPQNTWKTQAIAEEGMLDNIICLEEFD